MTLRKLSAGLLLILFLTGLSPGARAACGVTANGTVQPLSYLLTNEFQDLQAPAAISPGCIRDLIASIGQGNIGIEIDFFQSGVAPDSATLVKSFARTTVLPAGTSIHCNALTGAASAATLTVAANIANVQSNVGTLLFPAGGAANQGCTVTFNTSKTFTPGDFLEIIFPGTHDVALANVSVSIAGLQ